MLVELLLYSGERRVARYTLHPGQQLLLGRGEEAGIRIRDTEISRRHILFHYRKDGVYVTDLGSKNGTYVAGTLLQPDSPRQVGPGEAVRAMGWALTMGFVWDQTREEFVQGVFEDEIEVLALIGKGGSGSVWSGRHKLLNRMVAVKLLREDIEADSADCRRFLREARICAQVKSQYVIEIYDCRVVGKKAILVMELVQGPSVRSLMREEEVLPLRLALRVGADVARALEALAPWGVVHRDLKPANVIVTPDGPAKLIDFGIAKLLRQGSSAAITQSGMGLGTLEYVSPEQAFNAKGADGRSDIYSLGATAFAMLTGRAPFIFPRSGRNPLEVVRYLRSVEPPRVSEYRSDCPEEVVEAVHRMLAKDPGDRPSPSEVVTTMSEAYKTLPAGEETTAPYTMPRLDPDSEEANSPGSPWSLSGV